MLTDEGIADLAVEAGDLATDDGLETAVMVSLFTDHRAGAEELPPEESDPRGWWGDLADGGTDRIGSKLWLLAREKQTAEVVARAEEYAREALQWLIDDGVARDVDVAAAIVAMGVLMIRVRVARPGGKSVQYVYNWQAQASR